MKKLPIPTLVAVLSACAVTAAVAVGPSTWTTLQKTLTQKPGSATERVTTALQAPPQAVTAVTATSSDVKASTEAVAVAVPQLSAVPEGDNVQVMDLAAPQAQASTVSQTSALPADGGYDLSQATGVKDCIQAWAANKGRAPRHRAGNVTDPPMEMGGYYESTEGWTVIDANNDGITWLNYNVALRLMDTEHPETDDDWFISTAVRLQGGCVYEVEYNLQNNDAKRGLKDIFELRAGNAPTVEAMQQLEVIPVTEFSSDAPVTFYGSLEPKEDGFYYIGEHALSDSKGCQIAESRFKPAIVIGEAITPDRPGRPSSVVITPGADEAVEATVTCTAPTTTLGGEPLTGNLVLRVECEGKVMAYRDKVRPGEAVTMKVYPDYPGTYTYKVVAISEAGNGPSVAKQVYIGCDLGADIVTPPISWNWEEDPSLINGWNVIDNNEDGNTFYFNGFSNSILLGTKQGDYDEYLVSPGIRMKEGDVYRVIPRLNATKNLGVEVLYGTEPTVEGLTNVILPLGHEKPISDDYFSDDPGIMVPEADGVYYVAIHVKRFNFSNCDPAIAGLTVDRMSPQAPDVCELNITPDADGALGATIRVTAPATDVLGNALEGQMTLTLSRDGSIIKEVNNVMPNADVEFTDQIPQAGDYTYTMLARNAYGAGIAVKAKATIGTPTSRTVFTPPVNWNLHNQTYANLFSCLDANHDGKTFKFLWANNNLLLYATGGMPQDDWLFSPAFAFKPGMVYTVAVDAMQDGNKDQNEFEIFYGTEPSVEAMKAADGGKCVMPAENNYSTQMPVVHRQTMQVDETNAYYIGIHATSPKGLSNVVFTNFAVTEQNSTAPAPCEILDVTPDPQGGLTADVKIRVPSTNITGGALSGKVNKVELLRNGMSVAQQMNAVPGDTIVIQDVLTFDQAVLYSAVATKNNQVSIPINYKEKVFVGVPVPGKVLNAYGYATANPGEIQLHWDAVALGSEGQPLYSPAVSYNVFDADGKVLAENLTDTTYVATVAADQAGFYAFSIEPVTRSGKGAKTLIPEIPAGPADMAPVREYFSSTEPAVLTYVSAKAADASYRWNIKNNTEVEGMQSVEGDNGWLACESFLGHDITLVTNNISLAALRQPELRFNVWGRADDKNHVYVHAVCDGVRTPLADIEQGKLTPGWNEQTIDLSAFKGKTVYLTFLSTSRPWKQEGIWSYYFPIASMLDNVAIVDATAAGAPAAATVKVAADKDGAPTSVLTVTAPVKTFGAQDLTGNMTVNILRNGAMVGALYNVAPGATVNYMDQVANDRQGLTGYRVYCHNNVGDGPETAAQAFVGTPVPAAPTNINIAETEIGSVKLVWNKVTAGANGETIPSAQKITYNVCYGDSVLASGLTTTQWSGQVVPAGKQEYVSLEVYAVTSGGQSQAGLSGAIPVGTPLELPVAESFAEGTLTLPWGVRGYHESSGLRLCLDNTFSDLKSQDGDNGYMLLAWNTGLISGKINWQKGQSLQLWTATLDAKDDNTTGLRVWCDGRYEDILTEAHNELGANGWNLMSADLSRYADKTIQIEIVAKAVTYVNTFIDHITSATSLPSNLAAKNLAAPGKVKANQEFDITLGVKNVGSEEATGYNVVLYQDGQEAETIEGIGIAPGQTLPFTFSRQLTPTTKEATYYVAVEYKADLDQADNTTEPVTVTLKESSLPAVKISGYTLGQGNVLLWNEPQTIGGKMTETFEDAEPWSHAPMYWGCVDNDGGTVGGFNGIELPGQPMGGQGSWLVFDTQDPRVVIGAADAISGNQYMGVLFNGDKANDDWLISPVLDGKAQTVTLYARAYSLSGGYVNPGPEYLRFMYSTTGSDVADFQAIGTENVAVGSSYTRLTFDVPEGAKYFAIRYVSDRNFFLMMDDVTFRAGELDRAEGYNVYRDGELYDTCTTPGYVDQKAYYETHDYAVTTRYANGGESKASNVLTLTGEQSGLDDLDMPGADTPADVYNMQGQLMLRQVTVKEMRQRLAPGLYIHGTTKVYIGL